MILLEPYRCLDRILAWIRNFVINCYNCEENSHLAVASAIARGKGDFGLGIEKVAKQIDNIDFIPLQRERYDLVIKTENLENPINFHNYKISKYVTKQKIINII